jgi:hypothetical protein
MRQKKLSVEGLLCQGKVVTPVHKKERKEMRKESNFACIASRAAPAAHAYKTHQTNMRIEAHHILSAC